MNSPPIPLTDAALARGLRCLSKRDPLLARILKTIGPPPLWAREPGFPTLLHIILEQQVSLASARAAYERLLASAAPLTPQRFLELEDARLKAVGFSRQKMTYGRQLAQAVHDGALDLAALDRLDDATARAELIKVKGIGRWTADIYLLMALRRPDVWPSGDLALAVAVQDIQGLAARPTPNELETISAAWRPWRAVAARLLWRHYLNRRAARGR
ncbi:MAG TPA: DNA-3-methyladenine glycosylase 2 family protein [Anaerolineae bacterium]|nr:DNA-3-methyladenine glycosylase 2 family protein [Anaerolineae bacterium]